MAGALSLHYLAGRAEDRLSFDVQPDMTARFPTGETGQKRAIEAFMRHRARTLCEKLLSYASPLQLYAEEIEPHSGRHLGNFPQAFTHLALINAVMHIIDADQVLSEGTPDERSPDSGLQVAPAGAAPTNATPTTSHHSATGTAIGHGG